MQQQEEQSNRPHKINQKLEKRRKNEKKHLKEKKQKKKENKMKTKEKIQKEKDSDETEINYKKLKKVLQKFLKYYKDSLQDFYQIFSNLDEQAGSIDISGIEDKIIKKRLYQMFKYIKLDFNSENSEYKKPDRLKSLSIKRLIQKQVEKILESNVEQAKSESDDDENNNPPPEKPQKVQKQPEQNTESIQNQNIPLPINTLLPQQAKDEECLPQPQPKQYGPSLEFLKRLANDQEEEQGQQQQQNWMGENQNFTKFLDETFGVIEKQGQLDSCLSKRVSQKNQQKQQQPTTQENIDEAKYLGAGAQHQLTEEESKLQQEEIKEFMKEYDDKFRQKTLLEQHREDKKKKKTTKFERRPFDRDNDLRVIQCDTNKLFKMINSGTNSLSNRFGSSQYQSNFI